MQPKFGPISLGNIVPQEPNAFPLIHNSHVHRPVVVVVGNRETAANVRLGEVAVPRRQIVKEITLRIPEEEGSHRTQTGRVLPFCSKCCR